MVEQSACVFLFFMADVIGRELRRVYVLLFSLPELGNSFLGLGIGDFCLLQLFFGPILCTFSFRLYVGSHAWLRNPNYQFAVRQSDMYSP